MRGPEFTMVNEDSRIKHNAEFTLLTDVGDRFAEQNGGPLKK